MRRKNRKNLFKSSKFSNWDDFDKYKKTENLRFFWILILITSLFLIFFSFFVIVAESQASEASEYTDDQIVEAIYYAEGAEKAVKPFGILSVPCYGYADCRQICLNTVRNNRKRYAQYGYKQFDTYLEFLASRYAPIGASNDPKNLNQNWLKNVKSILKRRFG